VFEQIRQAGVDYDDVTATLEREGVQKFADSFAELLEGIRAKSGELAAA
jgi:transaldolase